MVSLELNPEVAKTLLAEGAYCVCVDVPAGIHFGIDMKSWIVGDKFLGVKMIPHGLHYIHYSGVNKFGDIAPKIGFVHNFKKYEVVGKKWNVATEELEDVDSETISHLKANLQNIDSCLGPYPFDTWESWKGLSDLVTSNLVDRLSPLCGNIRSALEMQGIADHVPDQARHTRHHKPFSDMHDDEHLLPNLKAVEGTELRFSKIPERSYPEGSTPSNITKHSLDATHVFNQIIEQHNKPCEILGELQFAFICFLVGHSLDAFEHWKRLVGILCKCDSALSKYRTVFDTFLTVLQHQLDHVPQDFLVDIVASQNFIYQSLRSLFATIHINSDLDGRLKTKSKRLEEALTEKFLWDFSDILEEDEEDLPVIVHSS